MGLLDNVFWGTDVSFEHCTLIVIGDSVYTTSENEEGENVYKLTALEPTTASCLDWISIIGAQNISNFADWEGTDLPAEPPTEGKEAWVRRVVCDLCSYGVDLDSYAGPLTEDKMKEKIVEAGIQALSQDQWTSQVVNCAADDGIGEKAFSIPGVATLLLEYYNDQAYDRFEKAMYSELE